MPTTAQEWMEAARRRATGEATEEPYQRTITVSTEPTPEGEEDLPESVKEIAAGARGRVAAEKAARAQWEERNQRAQEAATARGGAPGAGGPAQALGMMAGAAGQEVSAAEADLMRARRGRIAKSRDLLYQPTQEYQTASQAALDAERGAAEDVAEASALQQRRLADELDYEVREEGTRAAVLQAKQRVRVAAQEEALEAQQAAAQKVTEAADRLASAPDVDPGRYWASRTAGQKFAAMLGAGLLGFAGKSEVALGHIQGAIRDDIEVQKSNIAKRQQVVGARRQEFASSQVYAELLESFNGNERATDLAFETARLEEGQRKIQAMMASAGVQTLTAEQQQLLAGFQGRIADNNMRLAQMAAAHPSEFRHRRVVDRGAVEVAEGRLKAARGMQSEAFKGAVKTIGEVGKVEAEQVGKVPEEEKLIRTEMRWISQQRGGEKARYDVKLAHEIRKFQDSVGEAGGIKGLGGKAWWGSKQQIALNRIVEYLGRSQSGARIADEELANFKSMVMGKVSEGQTMRNIDDLLDTTEHVLEDTFRGVSEEARRRWMRQAIAEPISPHGGRRSGGEGELSTLRSE